MAGSIPDAPDVATEVADLLHLVTRTIRRQALADSEPTGVTGSHMRALRTLAHSGAPMRMSELADALGIVRRSATSVVDELERLSLVERFEDVSDRRAVGVQLTAMGRKFMADARRRRRTAAGRVLAPLEPSQLDELRKLLRRVVDTV